MDDIERKRVGVTNTSSAIPPNPPEPVELRSIAATRISKQEADGATFTFRSPGNYGDFYMRMARADDLDEIKALHHEWFPIEYGDTFFDDMIQGTLPCVVVIYRHQWQSSTNGSSWGAKLRKSFMRHGTDTSSKECIVAILVYFEKLPNCYYEDVGLLVKHAALQRLRSMSSSRSDEKRYSMALLHYLKITPLAHWARFTKSSTYILTLGVAEPFRGKGIAKELIRLLLLHSRGFWREVAVFPPPNDPSPRPVMLHCADYNVKAIKFYEENSFDFITILRDFYDIYGKRYNSALFIAFPSSSYDLQGLLGEEVDDAMDFALKWNNNEDDERHVVNRQTFVRQRSEKRASEVLTVEAIRGLEKQLLESTPKAARCSEIPKLESIDDELNAKNQFRSFESCVAKLEAASAVIGRP